MAVKLFKHKQTGCLCRLLNTAVDHSTLQEHCVCEWSNGPNQGKWFICTWYEMTMQFEQSKAIPVVHTPMMCATATMPKVAQPSEDIVEKVADNSEKPIIADWQG